MTGRVISLQLPPSLTRISIAFWILAFAPACATTGKPMEAAPKPPDKGSEVGPAPISVSPSPLPLPVFQQSYGPEPVAVKPMILVLGPGMTKAFAHAGVIKEIVRAKIPVGAIVGTEMGALIGALYCQDKSANSLEWKTQKIKESALLDRPIFGNGPVDGTKLESHLEDLFEKSNEQTELKCPVWIVTRDQTSGTLRTLREGRISRYLRMGFSQPARFKPLMDQGGNTLLTVTDLRDLAREAKTLASGPVVVVRMDSDIPSQEELSIESDWVISVDVSTVPSDDFRKRSLAIFKGAEAARASLDRLRSLTGLGFTP